MDTPEKAAERERKFREDAADKAALQQAARQGERPRTAPRKKKNDTAAPASYDIDRFEERLKTTVPKLKKKEKR